MDLLGMDAADGEETSGSGVKTRPRRAERDPTLYELSDYV